MPISLGIGTAITRGGGTAWSPLSVSGLQFWVDASDATTLYTDSTLTTLAVSDGDVVGGWKDKSGNSRNALQTDGTKKPLLKLAIINGRNAARFNSTTTLNIGDYFKHQQISVVAVLKITTTGICVPFSRGGSGNYDPAVALIYNRSGTNTSASFNPSGTPAFVNVSITQNQTSTVFMSADGSTLTNTTNGTTVTAVQSGALQFNTNTVQIGQLDGDSGLFAAGDYCEFLVYSQALTGSDKANVLSYLQAKWGTP